MIPLLIVRAYRLIPPRMRAHFGGRSTSHLALAAILAGAPPWAALWRYGRPRMGDGGFFGDWGT
jgi:hypothetical protein